MSSVLFDDVHVSFGERSVLRGITAELSEQRIAIIGANGSGKSTLARLINGLGTPTSGAVTVNGISVADDAAAVRREVGFIFSDAENQILMPTVREDVAFSLRGKKINGRKLSRDQKEQKVAAALARFGLSDHAEDSPYRLSGGQKQLLALASVLVTDPRIIIADEPTTLLDLKNRLLIRTIFDELPQQLIVVTHDLPFVRGFDRAIWIEDGHIRADGPADTVCATYEQTMESHWGASKPTPGLTTSPDQPQTPSAHPKETHGQDPKPGHPDEGGTLPEQGRR